MPRCRDEIERRLALKATKFEVHYTEFSNKKNERCYLCEHFKPDDMDHKGTCGRVIGFIDPVGVCRLFSYRVERAEGE